MAARNKCTTPSDAAIRELQEFGLTYPGAHTKSPWPGHRDLAIKDKTFAFMSAEGELFRVSCKLPHSQAAALSLAQVEPTAYGLGKSGWVTFTSSADDAPPIELIKAWIDESYRAIAPKKLVAELEARRSTDAQEGAEAPARKNSVRSPKTTPETEPRPSRKVRR